MKILMCRPEYYGINYAINPWMNVQEKVDTSTALRQWENLYDTIAKCGADIALVEPVPGWPDLVFTANAGLLYNNAMIVAHFKFKERQGEEDVFYNWFKNNGFDILNPNYKNEPFFEGAGDALMVGDQLFAAYGLRTDKSFYKQAAYLDHSKITYCELVDPYFYHLDTCFCPINEKLAIWYPNAFSDDTQTKMRDKIELIDVNYEEAKQFACNAVVLNNHIILPAGCPDITKKLEDRGYTVHSCEVFEYLKAGGACKCLTLRID